MSEKDMLKSAVDIVAAEETGLAVARELSKVRHVVEVKPHPTHIIERTNIPINGDVTIINEQGMGVLQEFMLKAEGSNFSVSVFRDDRLEINGSYSHYASISQEVGEIAAFERNGVYVFHVSDIEFSKSLLVIVSTAQSVTFNNIFAKYKLG